MNVTKGVPKEKLNWTDFRKRFEENFLSKEATSTLVRKVSKLEHGEMIMLEYVKEFEKLSKHGHGILNTLLKKNKMFIRGLMQEIARATIPRRRDPFNVMVDMAMRNEDLLASFGENQSMKTTVLQDKKILCQEGSLEEWGFKKGKG